MYIHTSVCQEVGLSPTNSGLSEVMRLVPNHPGKQSTGVNEPTPRTNKSSGKRLHNELENQAFERVNQL